MKIQSISKIDKNKEYTQKQKYKKSKQKNKKSKQKKELKQNKTTQLIDIYC